MRITEDNNTKSFTWNSVGHWPSGIDLSALKPRPQSLAKESAMHSFAIRQLVEKALYTKQLTPDIEEQINSELSRLGYISEVDYEALELLMSEMDEGRIKLVPSMR